MFPSRMESPQVVRNLLFVDDESKILDSIRRSLHGVEPEWRLLFASSVDQALVVLAGNPIDVVITNVTMPRRDGFDLMNSIASDYRLKYMPIIVLTGPARR